ncbi:hypothetical protein BDF20DRAFT_877506 [Mycotypha africana]|uniref:uncharacterized protein n=1 Tax=Mycotypha africana TaxID=64632 RepID=UPI002300B9FC|nr:uncharacterized protein BDF20DRAFT_877506 [Mycotypha africana]KAI8975225.1 hypothetical protein BDF20DRAFT_877506 [Mycotypha africana]
MISTTASINSLQSTIMQVLLFILCLALPTFASRSHFKRGKFDVIRIEYVLDIQSWGVVECTLYKPLTSAEIKRVDTLQCLNLPVMTTEEQIENYCGVEHNDIIEGCYDIESICNHDLNGKITAASENCRKELLH